MLEFNIALSALRASQRGLQVTANNLANSATPGYHRQSLVLTESNPIRVQGLNLGTGVTVERINRARAALTEVTLNAVSSQQGTAQARLDTLQKIESLFAPGDGSIHAELENFFTQLDQLATNPGDVTIRRGVVQGAQGIARSLNAIADGLSDLQQDLDTTIDEQVDQVNTQIRQVADLNAKIAVAKGQGGDPNDLLDMRDQILKELSNVIDVRVIEAPNVPDTVYLAGGSVVFSTTPVDIERTTLSDGTTQLVRPPSTQALTIPTGSLAGLLEARNELVGFAREQLNEFSQTLIRSVDSIHAAGLGQGGAQNRYDSSRPVGSVTAPLAQAGTAFPVSKGSLYVGVTNQSTGVRTVHRVNYDPAVDSLNDIAARLGTVPNVQGLTQSAAGSLSIVGDVGYTVDFAGQYPSDLQTTAWTGTSKATFSGAYSGTANEQYTFAVNGSGRVGVDAGLSVDVFNTAGERIATLDVGSGYSPGSPLTLPGGVKVQFSAGTITGGESGTAAMVRNSDNGGLLSALGINSLFTGAGAGDLAVRQEIVSDPSRLSAGQFAVSGDNEAAKLLAQLRTTDLFGGVQSAEEYLSDLTALQAFRSQDAKNQVSNLEGVTARLEAERDGVSGVDTNEELMNMLQYQRMFQAASRFMLTVNDTLQELMSVIR